MSGLRAAAGWEGKPFNTWTDAELKSLVTASPWAGPGSIIRIKKDGTPGKTPETVVISWTSALPMRQAVARERIGLNAPITKEVEAFLAAPIDSFIVAVKVTGTPEARSLAAHAGTAQTTTSLTPRDKQMIVSLHAEGVLIDGTGKVVQGPGAEEAAGANGGSLLVFAFPRSAEVTGRAREVEFVSQIDEFLIRRTFHVNEMVYNGKLEL
jgi:hypothetical protein